MTQRTHGILGWNYTKSVQLRKFKTTIDAQQIKYRHIKCISSQYLCYKEFSTTLKCIYMQYCSLVMFVYLYSISTLAFIYSAYSSCYTLSKSNFCIALEDQTIDKFVTYENMFMWIFSLNCVEKTGNRAVFDTRRPFTHSMRKVSHRKKQKRMAFQSKSYLKYYCQLFSMWKV